MIAYFVCGLGIISFKGICKGRMEHQTLSFFVYESLKVRSSEAATGGVP